MGLSLEWFNGLSPEEKLEAQKILMNSKASFSVLADFLTREIMQLETGMLKKESYDTPNWAFQQADYLGAKRTLTKLLKMIDPIINNQG